MSRSAGLLPMSLLTPARADGAAAVGEGDAAGRKGQGGSKGKAWAHRGSRIGMNFPNNAAAIRAIPGFERTPVCFLTAKVHPSDVQR